MWRSGCRTSPRSGSSWSPTTSRREVIPACVDGAAFAGAHLVVLVSEGVAPPDGLPVDATVLAAPADDEGAFAALVGGYAAAVDDGTDPAEAFRATTMASGWAASPADVVT